MMQSGLAFKPPISQAEIESYQLLSKVTRLLARERFALRPAINADRLMKPIPHSVNLELAGLFKLPLSKCLAQCNKGGVDAAFYKMP
jgi:hypothetical protein